MPTNTVKKVWLEDKDGAKIAPKTLVSQVQTPEGVLLEDKIRADLDTFKEEVLEEAAQAGGSTEEIEAKIEEHNADATAHSDIRDVLAEAQDAVNAALPKAGGTMTGALVAQNNNDYDTKQVRNIFLVAEGEDLPAGSNGDICLIYVP